MTPVSGEPKPMTEERVIVREIQMWLANEFRETASPSTAIDFTPLGLEANATLRICADFILKMNPPVPASLSDLLAALKAAQGRAVAAESRVAVLEKAVREAEDKNVRLQRVVDYAEIRVVSRAAYEHASIEERHFRDLIDDALRPARLAALSGEPGTPTPSGVRVPEEATEEMIEAGAEAYHTAYERLKEYKLSLHRGSGLSDKYIIKRFVVMAPVHWMASVYRAMLSARPSPSLDGG